MTHLLCELVETDIYGKPLEPKKGFPINGFYDYGPRWQFTWKVERVWRDEPPTARVGSWDANHYFPVKWSGSEKRALAEVKKRLNRGIDDLRLRILRNTGKRPYIAWVFTWVEDEHETP